MTNTANLFDSAGWYDCTTNWPARLQRELPVLMEVFGHAKQGRILDAGCGNGRQAIALTQCGYQVVGADANEGMLQFARKLAAEAQTDVQFVQASYETLHRDCGGEFDAVYCIGNSLAAAGSPTLVAKAIEQFAACLRVGGRLFIQVLNFSPMRKEVPCVRGPRVASVQGRQYVSVRQFHFGEREAMVTNVTIWKEGEWKQLAHAGRLYPIERDELAALCERSGLEIDSLWGSYAKEPFDVRNAADLIVVATRK